MTSWMDMCGVVSVTFTFSGECRHWTHSSICEALIFTLCLFFQNTAFRDYNSNIKVSRRCRCKNLLDRLLKSRQGGLMRSTVAVQKLTKRKRYWCVRFRSCRYLLAYPLQDPIITISSNFCCFLCNRTWRKNAWYPKQSGHTRSNEQGVVPKKIDRRVSNLILSSRGLTCYRETNTNFRFLLI